MSTSYINCGVDSSSERSGMTDLSRRLFTSSLSIEGPDPEEPSCSSKKIVAIWTYQQVLRLTNIIKERSERPDYKDTDLDNFLSPYCTEL